VTASALCACPAAAAAAGAFAVGVTNSLPAEVLSQHADMVVDSLTQLDLERMMGQQQQQQQQQQQHQAKS
jgi:hypothetical protein